MRPEVLLSLAQLGAVAVAEYQDWLSFGPYCGPKTANRDKERFGAALRQLDVSQADIQEALGGVLPSGRLGREEEA